MKKLLFFFLILGLLNVCFAQESDSSDDDTSEVVASKGGYAEVPPAKRPKPIDQEKAAAAAEKDESPEDEENNRNTIRYGLPSEIGNLLDTLLKNDDPRFTEEIYDLFQVTKSPVIKEKVIKYFTKAEDPCLEDFAVDLLNDPYDENNSVVKATFQYVSAVKTKAAIPAVITLVESENENYFNDAISTLGDIGGPEEAMFMVEYLERDDLSDAQRQTLMRNCGKMHAVETWGKLVDILDNDDENTFVRMYAAESLGLMEVDKSVPVLVEHFNETDPNLRQYVIKGLSHFPDVVEAKATVIQGIRDEHWKVRQEAIRTVKQNETKDAVPYLIYRAKNDSEKLIKEESYASIAALNTDEGNDFLVAQLKEKKVADGTKKKIVEVLLKEDHAGEKDVIELAKTVAKDDKRKDLRYAIAKEMVKNYKSSYDEVAELYLQSKDSTTISLGLDMYKQKKSSSLEAYVNTIANEKKNSANKTRAQKLLGIEEKEENTDAK